jgi:tRNA A-37 threonylcarbamoyl transferase component Bud32
MKYLVNQEVELHYDAALETPVRAMMDLLKADPLLLRPLRKAGDMIAAAFAEYGFRLYPTVLTTVLFYDGRSDCFFKVLQPTSLKKKALFAVTDRAAQIFKLSETLRKKGLPLPKVMAYGKIRKGNRPVFVMKSVGGRPLYDLLIREGKSPSVQFLRQIIKTVSELHREGYWLGDAHLSHIFVDEADVTGLIDIDSIRKNRSRGIRNFAKDLAGLNHPRLLISEDKKRELLCSYMETMALEDRDGFLAAVKHYSERRWKG